MRRRSWLDPHAVREFSWTSVATARRDVEELRWREAMLTRAPRGIHELAVGC